MFVNNYKTLKKFLRLGYYDNSTNKNYNSILNSLGGIKKPSGSALDAIYIKSDDPMNFALNSFSSDLFRLSSSTSYCYGLDNYGVSGYCGLYLALGNGTGEPSEEDYDLFSHFKYNEDYAAVTAPNKTIKFDGNVNQITISFGFKALKTIEVTEIGLTQVINYYFTTSSFKCAPFLLSHELLDEPMTFAEGELFSITYTVEIPLE